VENVIDEGLPPVKRRKLSGAEDQEKNGRKKANNRSDAVTSGLESPAVISLAVTKEGRHVVAVTGEDKSIRVFESIFAKDGKHQLRHLSRR
jgi:tRNA (guanine-N(7)-)-methyltransferase subunit TRM82